MLLLRVFITAAFLATSVHALCPRPERLENAGEFFSSNVYTTGSRVEYVCDPGRYILGHQRRTCQADGTWLPAGLPFCVVDVAKHKLFHAPSVAATIKNKTGTPSSSESSIFRPECYSFTRGRSHFWYVDLEAVYQVQVLKFVFANQTSPSARTENVTMDMWVGDNIVDLEKNRICSQFVGPFPHGRSLYVPCLGTLRGSHVMVRVTSDNALSLGVCWFQVLTERAAPFADWELSTTSPALNHTSPSDEGDEFGGYSTSKKMALVVGVVVALAGIVFFSACVLKCVFRSICRRRRRGGSYLQTDYPSTDSTPAEPERRRRHRTTSAVSSSEPALLAIYARFSARYSFKKTTRKAADAETPAEMKDVSLSSADATLPLPQTSPLTRKVGNYRESRLL